MRLLLAERTDPRQRHGEGGPPHPVERVGDVVGDMALDVADEAQRQMIVLDVHPARAGQAAPEQGKGERGVARNFEGGEKTRHDEPPFIESNSCL